MYNENSYAFFRKNKIWKNCIFQGINKILLFCSADNSLDPDAESRSSE